MFWRRLVRWLVDGVPDQVNLLTGHDRVEPGEAVRFTAEVLDTAYVEVNDAHVEAHITSPSGKAVDVPMEWTVEHDGEYGAVFNPDEPGLYEIKVTATRDGKELGDERDAPARVGRRQRVLRRGDARAAAQAHRRGNRRPLLHAGQRGVAARGDQLQRPRRHGRRRARTVGHAGAAAPAAGLHRRRVGATGARGDSRERSVTAESRSSQHEGSGSAISACSAVSRVLAAVRVARGAAAAQDSHLLVITGVAGDEEHAKQFHEWATTLIDAAKTKDGVARRQHHVPRREARHRRGAHSRPLDAARTCRRPSPTSRRRRIPDDQVVIVLIGHGSFDGSVAAFNLPGPD